MSRRRREQPALFEAKPRLEVHEHTFVTGPRARGVFIAARQKTTSTFSHSHEGGDVPHQHPDTGPATYTIDKDEWFRATGLKGGGRKVFTAQPSGEQFPVVELEDWQKTFEVVIGDNPPGHDERFEGGGHLAAERMVQQFGMRVSKVTDIRTRRKS